MATIIQHIPDFFKDYGFEPNTVEFSDLDELLEIPFVHAYTISYDGTPDEYFHQFALDNNRLLAECNRGKSWALIGTIDDPSGLNLPQRKTGYEENSEKCEGSFGIS